MIDRERDIEKRNREKERKRDREREKDIERVLFCSINVFFFDNMIKFGFSRDFRPI